MTEPLIAAGILAGLCVVWGLLAAREAERAPGGEAPGGCGACAEQDRCSVPLGPNEERSDPCLPTNTG